MKAKPFKGTAVPSLAGKSPFETLARAEAVALVAGRVRGKHDDERTVRNQVSVNVYDAVKAGKLDASKLGLIRLGDLGTWARAKAAAAKAAAAKAAGVKAPRPRSGWHNANFDDVPMFPISGGASLTLPAFCSTATGYTHPKTLRAAIEEIHILRAQIRVLAKALAMAEGRVRELEPDAQKRRNWIETKKGKRAVRGPRIA